MPCKLVPATWGFGHRLERIWRCDGCGEVVAVGDDGAPVLHEPADCLPRLLRVFEELRNAVAQRTAEDE